MDLCITKVTDNDLNIIDYLESTLNHRILSKDNLISCFENKNIHFFKATISDELVGYLCAEFMVDHFDLLAVCVHKNYRKQNIGTRLLQELFNLSQTMNVKDIFLEVRSSNLPAINFYNNLGFKKINIRKKYYQDNNEDAYVYKKTV